MTPPIPTLRELLTRRQFEVVSFLSQGLTDKEIADKLGIADGTISHHVTEAMQKANVTKRALLATRYVLPGTCSSSGKGISRYLEKHHAP